MAKKSLKKRIDALVDALGGAQKPTFAEIRSELVAVGAIAQELEDGQALSEKEAAIAALEAENENLKVELEAANAELEAFRADRRKQEYQNQQKEMPPVQFEILNRLSHESGYGDTLNEIAAVAKITVDEAEIHMDRLRKAGFAKRKYTWADDWLWRRTMAGNEYVIAKRLAGEAEIPERYRSKHADLPRKQHEAVLALARHEGAADVEQIVAEIGRTSIFQTENVLQALKKARFADCGDDPETWWLLEAGKDYLAERGLLSSPN